MSDSVRPHRWLPTRLPRPWDSPGRNTGVGCHFLHCVKVKSESDVAQSCPTLSNPMDCSLSGSSTHGIFQARVLEWGAIAFSEGMATHSNIPAWRIPWTSPGGHKESDTTEWLSLWGREGYVGNNWRGLGVGALSADEVFASDLDDDYTFWKYIRLHICVCFSVCILTKF